MTLNQARHQTHPAVPELKAGLPGLMAARTARPMSRAAVALRLGLPEERVTRWETGQSTPNVWVTLAVANAAGVGAHYLCCAGVAQ